MNTPKILAFLAFIILILLSACGKRDTKPYPESGATVQESHVVGYPSGETSTQITSVTVIILKDGTRCAVTYQGAISCDWKGSK